MFGPERHSLHVIIEQALPENATRLLRKFAHHLASIFDISRPAERGPCRNKMTNKIQEKEYRRRSIVSCFNFLFLFAFLKAATQKHGDGRVASQKRQRAPSAVCGFSHVYDTTGIVSEWAQGVIPQWLYPDDQTRI